MKQFLLLAILVYCVCTGCNQPQQTKQAPVAADTTAKTENKFKGVAFASTRDLSCGMPLSAGLEDTAHYKGKIYGFCSKECKDAFLKDPETSLKKQ